MAIKTLINGESVELISIQDRGLQYGDGIFETLAVHKNKVLCFDEHISRLQKGCERLLIPIPDGQLLQDEIASLIKTTEKGVVKIIITRGQGGRGYGLPIDNKPCRIISLYPWPEHKPENSVAGISARICQFRYSSNSILAGIKHLNRLEQIMARSEWKDESITEGIVLDNNDNVIEGTMSNIFIIKGNDLLTPDLSECGIAGIIRQKIIELSTTLGLNLSIIKISTSTLKSADEIFICNSIIGIWPVNRVDTDNFKPGPKTENIRQLLVQENIIFNHG